MLSVAILVRSHESRGQTAAEYLGVLLVVAAIVAALRGPTPARHQRQAVASIVRDIAGER